MNRLPWKLDSALCAAVFLIAGYYANRTKLLEKMMPYAGFLIPFFAGLKLLFRSKAQRICKSLRLPLHRTALLFWCCLFRYFRTASHCKAGCTSGYIRQCIFPFLAVLRPPLHASFFHSELRPVLLCGAHSAHHRRGIKTNGMDADQAFHLRPDARHLRSDLPDRLALGLL